MEEVLCSKDMIVIAVFVRNFEAANVLLSSHFYWVAHIYGLLILGSQ